MIEATTEIYNKFFNEEEKMKIKTIINDLTKQNYCSDSLWEFDKSIGGIGGYCMPINPTFCYFQGTEVRNIYRGYQYARSRVDICDISVCARDIIRDCGAELEDLLQLLLSKKLIFRLARDFGIEKPLGVLIKEIEKRNMLPIELIGELKLMLRNYNISKHDINIDEERERTFLTEDAIIYYLACRKIGIKILKIINTPLTNLANETFDIIYKRGNFMEVKFITKDGMILIPRKE